MTIICTAFHFLIAASIYLSITSAAQFPGDTNATVYEMLPKFGLPSGLLPSFVTSYSYTPSDDRFEVELTRTCYIQFDYLVYYDRRITGKLKYGSITELKGIEVQKFFLLMRLELTRRCLDVSQFQTVRACKNKALVACGNGQFIEPLAVPEEVEMLLTE